MVLHTNVAKSQALLVDPSAFTKLARLHWVRQMADIGEGSLAAEAVKTHDNSRSCQQHTNVCMVKVAKPHLGFGYSIIFEACRIIRKTGLLLRNLN